MASDTRQLKVVIDGDGKGGQRALKSVDDGLHQVADTQQRTHEGWKRFGAVLAAVSAVAAMSLGHLAASSLKAASDLGETTSKVGVVFGQSAEQVLKFGEAAAVTMGQSKQQALDAAATLAIYGKAANLSGSELVNFSTGMAKLASDMASFSNTTPQEAIQAIGAAMRGEMDPIERFGVLLNETVLKQVALKNGIIKTTTAALTPQQRVLAVQIALYEQLGTKGSGALGDFQRTSAGLANQQRILSAQWHNWKTQIGQALLPVATAFVTMLNTKLMPALNTLWAKAGPGVTAFLANAATKAGELIGKLGSLDWSKLGTSALTNLKAAFDALKGVDWGTTFIQLKATLASLGPALKDLSAAGGKSLADLLNVGAVALKFFAEHSDLLAKALPYLIAGFIAFKTVQAAVNAIEVVSPVLRLAEVAANFKLAASNHALTASLRAQSAALGANAAALTGNTIATTAGDVATKRNIFSTIAHRVATIAATIATKAAAVGQWLLNIAMYANPIGLIILAVIALVAAIIWLWRNNETFRKIVIAGWTAVKAAVLTVVDWFKVAVPAAWEWIKTATLTAWEAIRRYVINPVLWLKDALSAGFEFYIRLITQAWQWIFDKTSATWNWIRTTISHAITGTKLLVTLVVNQIHDHVVAVFTFVRDKAAAIWAGLKAAVAAAVDSVRNTVIGLKNAILGVFSGAHEWLVGVGRDIINGLLRGIEAGFQRVKNKLRELTNLLPSWKGPQDKDRKLLQPAGRNILAGLVTGFRRATPDVKGSLAKLTADLGTPQIPARLAAPAFAGAPGIHVTVNVSGNVTAERDLARAIAVIIRDEIARNGNRNGGHTGL